MATTTILFDLDDTLVVDEAAVEAALLATCALARERYGIAPQTLASSVRRCARALWQAASTITYCRAIGISSAEGLWARFLGDDPHLETLHDWAPTYRREAWSQALADHGIADIPLAEHLADVFPRQRRAHHQTFPEAETVLQNLRKRCRLALVTNGAPDLQREKLERSGLASYFQAVVVSGEIGAGKPDPLIFVRALAELRVSPAEAVMVGNDLTRDVMGAHNAGLRGIWINRAGHDHGNNIISPAAEIATLEELLSVLYLGRAE